ncbi:uncharacterized protein BDW43DRAFT_276130 [Aspergillus alliaceus]|uniref:uncharacterized protein n=1 Tax=Petromyces alliaceus TaxID=209559 RepID=UPI0012A42ACC|nr:uncharacterized protein BDW43DRAFT_276130 [Aspergillus alliaceus]KAB8233382.1 hypothetical protein BDW43DRAFT_276130 [Aspergillus alliaceus]
MTCVCFDIETYSVGVYIYTYIWGLYVYRLEHILLWSICLCLFFPFAFLGVKYRLRIYSVISGYELYNPIPHLCVYSTCF